ncbi:MAG: hypothetical protein V6Z81_09195 [Parvularculales bacterium]
MAPRKRPLPFLKHGGGRTADIARNAEVRIPISTRLGYSIIIVAIAGSSFLAGMIA